VEAATSFNGEEAAGEQAQFFPLGSTKMVAASAGGSAVTGICRMSSCRKSQDDRVDCAQRHFLSNAWPKLHLAHKAEIAQPQGMALVKQSLVHLRRPFQLKPEQEGTSHKQRRSALGRVFAYQGANSVGGGGRRVRSCGLQAEMAVMAEGNALREANAVFLARLQSRFNFNAAVHIDDFCEWITQDIATTLDVLASTART